MGLGSVLAAGVQVPDVTLALATRQGNHILNFYCCNSATPGDVLAVQTLLERYGKAKPRPGQHPSPAYNCHGLTFGARRTQIKDGAEVAKILREDGYRKLGDEVLYPGDIAIYTKEGEISHSGIVMMIERSGKPWLLSKWGRFHEAMHTPDECPYAKEAHVSYYRLER